MILKKDQIISLFFFVIAIVFIIFIDDIEMPKNLTEPGPRIMPYISITLTLIFSIGVFFESIKKKDKVDDEFLTKQGWKRLLSILLILFIYAMGLNYLGFLIATPFMAYTLINIFNDKKKVNSLVGIVSSILITISIYFLFSIAFNVMLPPGILFD